MAINPFHPDALDPIGKAATAILKGDSDGHPFRGNQYTQGSGGGSSATEASKNWGDKNSTKAALKDITAETHSADWEQFPMTDTAAKIMEAESRWWDEHNDTHKGSNDKASADAVPKWLVDSATRADLDALTDHNFHSTVRHIESQRPDLVQKSVGEIADWLTFAKGGPGSGPQDGHPFLGNQYQSGSGGGGSESANLTPSGHRPLSTIASEIRRDFRSAGKQVPFGAVPYLDALGSLHDIKDNYGLDSAKMIVAYLTSNLSGWRGDTARAIKAELKKISK